MNESARKNQALLSGNEAIARGAYEAGVRVGTAYPGTPSTEILENLRNYPGVSVEWSVNEKVALEVASGASFSGARAIVTMKHVGLNVAADPLMTLAYTGVGGGMVIVTADDPGMHSSQNEQDNRFFARFAGIPMFEPCDSEEARRLTREAFNLSERFDTPVLLRVTTRISHSKGIVELQEPETRPALERVPLSPPKYVMLPSFARKRAAIKLERLSSLRRETEKWVLAEKGTGDGKTGVITSGVCYQYVREIAPDFDILRLVMTHPFPDESVNRFAENHEKVFVIEELDTYLTDQVRALGIEVEDLGSSWKLGELDPDRVARMLGKPVCEISASEGPPPAPPVMCPGCPHRSTFAVLKELGVEVTGDIGCYTLGALPPLSAMHTCVNMGGGVSHAFGIEKAHGPSASETTVAVIGDSTFLHSGITSLLDIVYNGGSTTTIILDNSTTAMTGRQHHPGTGFRLDGTPAPAVDLEALCRALGVKDAHTIGAYNLDLVRRTIKEALVRREPSVIIVKTSCVLVERGRRTPYRIDLDLCTDCGNCMELGCPAIREGDNGKYIDPILCVGCDLCRQVCELGAIQVVEEKS
ncbi:MAG TPA: thiamine pyrophosphate-dependent enzyme [bacterium]|nr:thiamine pyrophosphate-dependent enzyme [bacterium]HPO07966.1 thiamine pyrophosphate-dependent enzyme [bacterium]